MSENLLCIVKRPPFALEGRSEDGRYWPTANSIGILEPRGAPDLYYWLRMRSLNNNSLFTGDMENYVILKRRHLCQND